VIDMDRLVHEAPSMRAMAMVKQHIRAHEHGVVAVAQCKRHKLMFSVGIFKVRSTTAPQLRRAEV
jgi:hypothetical protein